MLGVVGVPDCSGKVIQLVIVSKAMSIARRASCVRCAVVVVHFVARVGTSRGAAVVVHLVARVKNP